MKNPNDKKQNTNNIQNSNDKFQTLNLPVQVINFN